MRVLLLHGRLSDRGGADRWLLGVLARLQGRVETLLAVGHEDRALPRAERTRLGPWQRLKGLDRRGQRRRGLEGARSRLQDLIAGQRPQVIHVNDVTDPDLLQLVARSGRGVMTVQDHRFFCPGRGKVDAADQVCAEPLGPGCLRCFDDARHGQAMLELTRRRLEAVAAMTRITVLSAYMARQLAQAGVDRHKIEVLPPFVDGLTPLPRADGGRHHLLVGRLSVHKGVELALQAAGQLQLELPLVVAGEGPLAERVQQAAARPGSRVRFAGWAHRQALSELLAQARSLWLPSLWAEPFGIIGIEALAAGVPVIASNTGGVPGWLCHERDGLLVPPGDAAALANAADRLAADPQLARRLGAHGQARVTRELAPAALMDRLVAVYRELTTNASGQPRGSW